MGILNVTPDSFSGDGLLGQGGPGARDDGEDPIAAIVARGLWMAEEGADILDVGGESTRPGHRPVDEATELERVIPAIRALRAVLPDLPLSVDTTKPAVARAALEAGADVLNDVAAGDAGSSLAQVAVGAAAALVVMHGRRERAYTDVVSEVVADLRSAVDACVAAGCERTRLVVDPGFGFGKDAPQNLALLRALPRFGELGLPLLVGLSRKSTIGQVLGLPPEERLEGTLATTALAIAGGADLVRVHDVGPNVRAARMADAVVRGWSPEAAP
jgi:dihydropteroate synthase